MYCDNGVTLLADVSEIETLREGVCPVAWAKICAETAREAACGKSVMCRDGLTQLAALIGDIVSGEGQSDDLALIQDLCRSMVEAKDCEIAVKAATNIAYSLEHYFDEWEAHCRRHRCAAMVCPAYYSVYVDPALCTGCGKCRRVGVAGGEGLIHVITDDAALKTEEFFALCPVGAIKKAGPIKPSLPTEPVPVGSFEAAGGRRRRRRGAAAEEAEAPAAAPIQDAPAAEEKPAEAETPKEPEPPEEKEIGKVYEVRMNYQAGYEEYVKWNCEGRTIHSGVGWFHPFGKSHYFGIAGGECEEAKAFPMEKYFTEEWQRINDNTLFCIYRLEDGDLYAWDGIMAVRAAGDDCIGYNSDYFRRDILTNIIVGGTGRYEGASGMLIGTAEGAGDSKCVDGEGEDALVLPRSLIKSLSGYIKLRK